MKAASAVFVGRSGFELSALARNFHFLFSSAALNSSTEIWFDITQQETSLQGETIGTCKLNWNKNKHHGESCYSSAKSKLHTRPLRAESIFVVMMESPQFPLFNKVQLMCVPLPLGRYHGSCKGTTGQQRDSQQLHVPCLSMIFIFIDLKVSPYSIHHSVIMPTLFMYNMYALCSSVNDVHRLTLFHKRGKYYTSIYTFIWIGAWPGRGVPKCLSMCTNK